MFENIIGNEGTLNQLKADLNKKSIPNSILLEGPHYSGKMTAALEIARVLTCTNTEHRGRWNCPCKACTMNRLLINPDVVLTGDKYFIQEIEACGESLKSTPSLATQYLFVRSVRKLIRRFDPFLWVNMENRVKSVYSRIEMLEQTLEPVMPGLDITDSGILDEVVSTVIETAGKMISGINLADILIEHIRNIALYSHNSIQGKGRVFILENADRMTESARNALLKILEEPPRSTFFILTTTEKRQIIPTILSRLRIYHFAERSELEEKAVLEKIFRFHDEPFKELKHLFLSDGFSIENIRHLVESFVHALNSNEQSVPPEIISAVKKGSYRGFLEEFLVYTKNNSMLHKDMQWIKNQNHIIRIMRKQIFSSEHLNQNNALLLESLFYQLKEIR